MNLSIRHASRRRVAVASATSSLTLLLMLTACGSSTTAESADGAASSTSSSATTNSTSSPAAASSASNSSGTTAESSTSASEEKTSSAEENTDSAEAQTAENFAGSESLEKAETVSLDQEQVSQTQDLYGKFEDAVSSAETIVVESTDDEEENTAEEGVATSKTTTLDSATSEKISAIATGSASDEFLATALEFSTNGWKQEGKSKIVGEPKVANTTYQGKSAKILEVCLDSSEVSVKDSAGNVLTSDSTPKRSLNIFTLIEENGSWKIAAHDFPNNPDC